MPIILIPTAVLVSLKEKIKSNKLSTSALDFRPQWIFGMGKFSYNQKLH